MVLCVLEAGQQERAEDSWPISAHECVVVVAGCFCFNTASNGNLANMQQRGLNSFEHLESESRLKKNLTSTTLRFHVKHVTSAGAVRYLSSHARRLLAAPISSTTEVRKSLGGLREVLPSYAGLFLRSDVKMWRLLVTALILRTRLFKLSVSTP